MIVLDASAAVDWLLQTPAGQRIEERIYARKDTLHTVHLLDVELLRCCGVSCARGRWHASGPRRQWKI